MGTGSERRNDRVAARHSATAVIVPVVCEFQALEFRSTRVPFCSIPYGIAAGIFQGGLLLQDERAILPLRSHLPAFGRGGEGSSFLRLCCSRRTCLLSRSSTILPASSISIAGSCSVAACSQSFFHSSMSSGNQIPPKCRPGRNASLLC